MTLKMLDCFCGLGGVSDGFALEGFDVTGIDIEDMPAKGYKHKFIQADIKNLNGADYDDYDVIWGSPPCRDFSEFCRIYGKTWKDPPNPQRGLELVNAFLNFVRGAKPNYWVMENVAGLRKYFPPKPTVVTYLTTSEGNNMGKKHAFWGVFPAFLIPKDKNHVITYHKVINGKRCPKAKMNSREAAKIPLSCSRAFAKAIKEALIE